MDEAGAQCGEVTVPLDYARPHGRTITVAFSRLKATDTTNRLGTLLINSGGPGGASMLNVIAVRAAMKDVGSRFDLIGMDPRFVGRSTPLDCGWPVGTWTRAAGLDRRGFDRVVRFHAGLAARCARRHADVLPYVTTRNTARDMDVIRAALGEPRLSYLGYSYGSYLGAVYMQMFPHRAGRIVLDGALDPDKYGPRLLRAVGPANEAGLRDWADWAAQHHDRYGLGATRDQVLDTVDRVRRASARGPLRVGAYQVGEHVVPVLLITDLANDRDEGNARMAEKVRVLHRAAAGLPSEPTPALAADLEFILTGTRSPQGSAHASILCGDVAVPRDPDVYWRDIQHNQHTEPTFGALTRNISPCAFWPSTPVEQPRRIHNGVPAMIVAATGDTRTVYPQAQALHRKLTGSRLVTLEARVHGVYGKYGNACVDATVNAYLRDGVLPGQDLTCKK